MPDKDRDYQRNINEDEAKRIEREQEPKRVERQRQVSEEEAKRIEDESKEK